ncbi:UNVERIFIED_CONTAM: hypothetical protein PYX00_002576 [Menopon gallinae]
MANVSSQRFCLRWNNHQSNLLSVFDQLLQDESFVDVTLAVDGQFLRAHKMVLSACSPYFQTLFTDHPDKHPIVILKDVPYTDMRCLLDFMYRGEVSVDQDRLTAFLKVAESLRIKGLTEVNEDRCDLPSITNSLLSSQHLHSQIPPPQLHRISHPPSLKQQPVVNNDNYPVLLNSAPLLGSALTAPKRKRGRPRKLSGSSDFAPGSPNSDTDASDAKTSESILPELLEVKMDYGDKERNRESSCEGERYSNGEERRDRLNNEEHLAGTSQGAGRGNGHDGESYPLNNFNGGSSALFDQSNSMESKSDAEVQQSLPALKMSENVVATVEDSSETAGYHFLSDKYLGDNATQDSINEIIDNLPKARSDLLEYLVRNDGTVVCKWCGEVLPSRTHWYRHKYKRHVPSAGLPAGLIKCLKCNTFFKSRKGYVGHCVSRHGSVEEAEKEEVENVAVKEELKEFAAEVNETEDLTENIAIASAIEERNKKIQRILENWGRGRKRRKAEKKEIPCEDLKQREKEEKLVADIIAKVKKECEAQSIVMCRRGYSRRSTVMTSFKEYDKRK